MKPYLLPESSKKETKNTENDIKSEADIKSNSNYSSTRQTPLILICKNPNFHQITSKH